MLRCSKADFEEVDFSCGNPSIVSGSRSNSAWENLHRTKCRVYATA